MRRSMFCSLHYNLHPGDTSEAKTSKYDISCWCRRRGSGRRRSTSSSSRRRGSRVWATSGACSPPTSPSASATRRDVTPNTHCSSCLITVIATQRYSDIHQIVYPSSRQLSCFACCPHHSMHAADTRVYSYYLLPLLVLICMYYHDELHLGASSAVRTTARWSSPGA